MFTRRTAYSNSVSPAEVSRTDFPASVEELFAVFLLQLADLGG